VLAGELREVPNLGARLVGTPAFLPRCQSSHVRRRVEARRRGREWNRTSVPACGTACSVRADSGVRPCRRARRGAPSLSLAGDRGYLARSAAKARGLHLRNPPKAASACAGLPFGITALAAPRARALGRTAHRQRALQNIRVPTCGSDGAGVTLGGRGRYLGRVPSPPAATHLTARSLAAGARVTSLPRTVV
jgi:hypothetical protein